MPVVVNVSCWCGWRSAIYGVSTAAAASTASGTSAAALLRRPDYSTLLADSSDVSSLLPRCTQYCMCSFNTWLRSKCSRSKVSLTETCLWSFQKLISLYSCFT